MGLEPHDGAWAAPGRDEVPCQVMLQSFSASERTRRAARAAGLSWLVAAGCIFIPVFHFFLVPGFVLLGMGLAVRAMRTQQVVVHASGDCPLCQRRVTVDLSGARPRFPLWSFCPECRDRLRVLAIGSTIAPGPDSGD